mmetsp:Transcript_5635/g.7397  ORF Transcript_5635/g.7397 Transcript_5635/m.7397 type:complete len:261 (+) Transcript_5635:185-967(+)|eukprot:CAMPEP_0198138030 /NCGR_PEP_ID=MMETSP1443-20131203/1467_1 /TAXON_ID=186043 /ORGANISM="Entomoneis sp., Strain CCMP2396" /LENGTH=260 /DNA_ID=CAMNT_0043799653 /DNA_START=146 /DNA_END=928 /DNA_ORIENTATION=+
MAARCWKAPTTKDAYRLSLVSIIVTFLAALAGFLMFGSTGSSLVLVFALENCVDFFSSAVVLWRFFAPSTLDDALEAKLNAREKRASIAISFVLLCLGVVIIVTAIDGFTRGDEDIDELDQIIAVSFFSLLIFGILTAIKFRYSNILESASLYKDGLCSLIGTILSGAMFINTLLIREYSSIWWTDPLVALLCGISAIVMGTGHIYQARYVDQLPIFTTTWWVMSHGDGHDETAGRPVGAEDRPMGGQSQPDVELVAEVV